MPCRPCSALCHSVFSAEQPGTACNALPAEFKTWASHVVPRCSTLMAERHSAEQGLHGTSAAQTSVHACPLTPYFECLQLEHGDLCSQFGHTRIAPSRRHTHEHSTSAIPTLSHARCWAPWWQDMSGNARRLSRACKSAPCRRFMTGGWRRPVPLDASVAEDRSCAVGASVINRRSMSYGFT